MLQSISSLFCTRSVAQIDEEDKPIGKQQKFLNVFLKHSSIQSTEIYGYKIRHDILKDYVVYKILVKTPEIEYKIEKRFSEFFDLRTSILKVFPDFITEETFPSKRFFGNLCLETLIFRKERLSSFLLDVLKLQKEQAVAELIISHFFQTEILLHKGYYEQNHVDITLFSIKEEILNMSVTEDDRRMLELLFELNKEKENMIFSFSKLQEFFEKCPKLSLPILQILFKGYGSIKGLISLCGELNKQDDCQLHLACCSCLRLLCFLMDYEENSNAEAFLEIFGGLTSRDFASMGLAHHIVESPSKICKKTSLKLLDIYKASNPKTNSFLFSQILDNEEAFETFRKWKSSMTIVSQKTESFVISHIEDSNDLSADTKQESRNLFRLNSSFLNESKPKSGLFKRKQHKSSPTFLRLKGSNARS